MYILPGTKVPGSTLSVDELHNRPFLHLCTWLKHSENWIYIHNFRTLEIPQKSIPERRLLVKSSRDFLEGPLSLRLGKPDLKTQGHHLTSCVILGNGSSLLSLCKCWKD